MSDKERENFLHGAISRGPGKRQVRPTTLATENFTIHEDDSSSDDDFVHVSDEESGSAGSGESSEESGNDEEESENQSSSESQTDETVRGMGKPEPLICSVCLNMRNIEGDRVIQCDKCGVAVHECCYAVPDLLDDSASVVSNFSTEPWFCEPCLFELERPPHCELCPQQYGAFKRSDVGGKWVHLTCALYTPGISFGDVENLSAISWQEIDYKRFGRKPCNGCSHILEARTGITTQCEAGLCKHHYHISCAQRLGFLVDAESENLPEGSNKHVDPHFILCRVHNISELVAKKKQNYAIFMRQEYKRLIGLSRRMLDQRESFKLERQRKQFDDRIKKCQNDTIHLPAIHNKRTRLIQTSAEFLEAFAEKAELFGVSLEEFTNSFTSLPSSQITHLAPSFNIEFVKYYNHRENKIFKDEQKRLNESECELKMVTQAEKDLKLMLEKMANKSPENSRSHKTKSSLDHKFMNMCQKLNITIQEEEDVKNASDIEDQPNSKRRKIVEETPAKRRRNTSTPQTSPEKPRSQTVTSNFRTSLRSPNFRRNRRGSSFLSGSLDTTMESEDENESDLALPSSSNSPPCLKIIDEVESVNSEQSLNAPILLPMISPKSDESKRRSHYKNSKSKKRV